MVEVDEHTAASAVIATYTTDDDATWGTLAGDDATSFTFTNGSLAINDVPNYEDKASYAVTVVATDDNETTSLNVTVNVADDYGPEIKGPAMVEVDEHTAASAVIATYTTDDDATWGTLAGTDASSFTFNNGSLAINDVPNYEDKASYAVTVVATDDNETTSLNVTVNVADDYGPAISGPEIKGPAHGVCR
jgi:cation transport regulator ChaB